MSENAPEQTGTIPDRDHVSVAADRWADAGWDGGARLRAALSILRVEEIIRELNSAICRPYQLTHARHEALAVLYFSRSGRIRLGDLGRRLLLHPASTTSTVAALVALGSVSAVPDAEDRRAKVARITNTGREAFEHSSKAMLEAQFALEALTPDEAEQLYQLLRKVQRHHTPSDRL